MDANNKKPWRLEVHAEIERLHTIYAQAGNTKVPSETFRAKLQHMGWIAREDERVVARLLEAAVKALDRLERVDPASPLASQHGSEGETIATLRAAIQEAAR